MGDHKALDQDSTLRRGGKGRREYCDERHDKARHGDHALQHALLDKAVDLPVGLEIKRVHGLGLWCSEHGQRWDSAFVR